MFILVYYIPSSKGHFLRFVRFRAMLSVYTSLHFSAFLYISQYSSVFLCISLNFFAFLCILHFIFYNNLTERIVSVDSGTAAAAAPCRKPHKEKALYLKMIFAFILLPHRGGNKPLLPPHLLPVVAISTSISKE